MINKSQNELINESLCNEYKRFTTSFLVAWSSAFGEKTPCRINEFGIIDTNNYDTDNGILFIGKETNGWDDNDYQNGCLFRDWLNIISQNGLPHEGHIKQHPNMWYNIGRWTQLLTEPSRTINDIANSKKEAISAISKIAFTNVNKVRGKNYSGKEYYQLSNDTVTRALLQKEVEIINPKIIVCCGTGNIMLPILCNYSGDLYIMPHPGARKNKVKMLLELNEQIKRNSSK